MSFFPEDSTEDPVPTPKSADATPGWEQASSPIQASGGSMGASSIDPHGLFEADRVEGDAEFSLTARNNRPTESASAAPPDPAWNGWDVLRLIFLTFVAVLVLSLLVAPLIARWWLYPHTPFGEIVRMPLVAVAGQSVAYLLILAYMYVLVTRERRRPDFLAAIHWNWPASIGVYLLAGFVLSLGLQGLAHLLPIPKELPIDSFFRTPAEAWALGILSVTLAPLMEELFFRGFLYPVLAQRLGLPVAVLLTALGFAMLHFAQLGFSWGPVLVIFLVGLVLTMVRAKTNSVAAGVLIHMAYNGTITVAMFVATDGFRHLERLNQ
ncbi:MAG: CPBP family intramembrane glutamic endopeptidase [Terriglobales bacterium]